MPNLLTRFTRERHLSITNNGVAYRLEAGAQSTWDLYNPSPHIEGHTQDLIAKVHKDYGPVPAAVFARQLLVGQFRPRWRSEVDGRDFGTSALAPLERPQFTTRSELYRRIEAEVCYAGTAYIRRAPHPVTGRPGCKVLPSQRMRIIVGSSLTTADLKGIEGLKPSDVPDAYVAGYIYDTKGQGNPDDWVQFPVGEVVHFAPEPDPSTLFAGVSWVSSVLHDIIQDKHVGAHIDGFLERGAVPGLAVVFPKLTKDDAPLGADELKRMQQTMQEYHAGASGRGRALILAGGAKVSPVGATLDHMALRDLTSGYESRIASRARVPATVLGLKEALQGSSLNQGNYAAARRQWGDGWATPTLEALAQALEPLVERPDQAELSYIPSAIGFFQEDLSDQASIAQTNANAVRTLVDAGFTPESAVAMVASGKVDELEHGGLPSVQLQQGITPESESMSSDD